jgi:hypothetical protein
MNGARTKNIMAPALGGISPPIFPAGTASRRECRHPATRFFEPLITPAARK